MKLPTKAQYDKVISFLKELNKSQVITQEIPDLFTIKLHYSFYRPYSEARDKTIVFENAIETEVDDLSLSKINPKIKEFINVDSVMDSIHVDKLLNKIDTEYTKKWKAIKPTESWPSFFKSSSVFYTYDEWVKAVTNKSKTVTVPLNGSYNAVIDSNKNTVQVGCQLILIDNIRKLVQAYDELHKK